MAQLGHADPGFTLRVYARAMGRAKGAKERLKALVADPIRHQHPETPFRTPSPQHTHNEERPLNGEALGGWARLGSNQRPLACEASALPLSYAPQRGS